MRTSLRGLVTLSLVVLVGAGCNGGGAGRTTRTSAGSTTAPVSSKPPTTTPPAPTPAPAPAPTPAPVPTFATGTFDRTFNGRAYKLHVPVTATAPLRSLVCFHGSGDDVTNFFDTLRAGGWIAAADKLGLVLIVPATKSPYQSFPVWSGNPNNDIPAMGTERDDVLALVDQDVTPTWPLDPKRLHALGFSDGGLFVACVGLSSPRFATATILGYGWGAFQITPTALRPPVHMACGTSDSFYASANSSRTFLTGLGHDVLWEPCSGVGHSLLGISATIGPENAIAWLLARP